MENKVIQERLSRLREVMAAKGIDFYLMPTADFHNSEYVNDYFKVREYFSNFTGSNGTLLVWQEGAGLWTDGRYFIQAARELTGTTIELFRMQDEGVPTIEEFLKKQMKEGQTLGFDGRVISVRKGKKYEETLKEKQVRLAYTKDLAEEIWLDRPPFPAGKVTVLEEALAGKSVKNKLSEVRQKLLEEGAESTFISKLDDLMWLFNIRGCDVACNPVAMSYAYISDFEAVIFIQEKALDTKVKAYFEAHGIVIKEYSETLAYLENLPKGRKILVDDRYCSYATYKAILQGKTLIEKKNPTELLKAVKNPVELSNMKEVFLLDSVAVTKFIYWLKTHVGKEEITEVTAAEYLDGLRRQIPGFLDLSFPTIAAYGVNGAIIHYSATAKDYAVLAPEGMLMVDSGGQYLGGTTDVTRTIVLGSVSEEIKKQYTMVAAGMLQLSNARWIYGCTGRNLDILARQPLWEMGLDFKHGTGHGIGYILNVHEGPQNLRWKFAEDMTEAVLEAGMITSNEPGVYIEGSHGIRIENIIVACNGEKNEYGQFMYFDTLTYAPIDLEGIEPAYLNDTQKEYLNTYHRMVREKIGPYLTAEELEWLQEATREI